MEIADPIYDAAFQYLMQDDRAARLLVGRIAGLEVESLALRPQELATPRDATRPGDAGADQPPVALFRMDFAARARTAGGGERHVLIEIQKTNAPTVVERFRTYLGQQMCSSANVIAHASGRREAVPIVTIYLLGAEYERREKERERQRPERAEQALALAPFGHLHRLGHETPAIAAALSIDVDEVRRVLADADGGEGSA